MEWAPRHNYYPAAMPRDDDPSPRQSENENHIVRLTIIDRDSNLRFYHVNLWQAINNNTAFMQKQRTEHHLYRIIVLIHFGFACLFNLSSINYKLKEPDQ